MSDTNDEKIIFDIWPRTPKKGSMSYKVMMYDIADQVAITLYDKRLADCLGTAQNVRSKKLKNYDIRVHIPRNPNLVQQTKNKNSKNSWHPMYLAYSKSEDPEITEIRGRVFSMIEHGKRRGIQIRSVKIK